ncbi:MAG: hypothetical protein EXR77_08735 [Myxococcales bacterium]|nr:hypothetical protein [Myxococcales bacterium]
MTACLALHLAQAKHTVAGVGYALLVAAKQTNLLFVPLVWTARAPLKTWLVAAGIALATVLPFAVLAPQAFLQSTVLVFAAMPPRTDGFSLWTVTFNEAGLQLPPLLTLLSLAAPFGLAVIWARRGQLDRALAGVVLALWALFLTARQSFTNYHYFAHALLLLLLAVRLAGQEQTTVPAKSDHGPQLH